MLGKRHLGPQSKQDRGSVRRGPRLGANPLLRPHGDTPTGYGELKLERGEWEAADTAILYSLHPLWFHSCSTNLILSFPPPPY